jgi:hypothetical protein
MKKTTRRPHLLLSTEKIRTLRPIEGDQLPKVVGGKPCPTTIAPGPPGD